MASEDLLKKAVAAFNALSTEQQAEMLEEQRQSWVRGNVGLSRDERDMTSPAMREVENRLAPLIKAVNSWADRTTTPIAPVSPDATGKCGELVTVGEVSTVRESVAAFAGRMLSRQLKPGDLLCLRSQTEELLAAERARAAEKERLRFEGDLDKWMKIIGAGITGYQPEAYALMDLACHELVKLRSDISAIAGHVDCEADSDSILHIIRDLEADNAALTARVKELEKDFYDADKSDISARDLLNDQDEKIEALEAKLAAAERALTMIAKVELSFPEEHREIARAALGGKPS
ncbi:hypothetical protein F9K98_13520 [Brucella anthropi]|uniref:hypothetical protein n=1 Tax=Brucella anthropi TaxID=529 RepID=UPI00124D9938|nr:hypothetical protein [Brucella anthropi]KAB2762804.1 hypothetical protein F9K98_13520 [Brucella anthropi]